MPDFADVNLDGFSNQNLADLQDSFGDDLGFEVVGSGLSADDQACATNIIMRILGKLLSRFSSTDNPKEGGKDTWAVIGSEGGAQLLLQLLQAPIPDTLIDKTLNTLCFLSSSRHGIDLLHSDGQG